MDVLGSLIHELWTWYTADEPSALHTIAVAVILSGAAAFAGLQATTAPYGRYNTASRSWVFGCNIPGRLAWVLQECPCVIAVAAALAVSGGGASLSRVQATLLAAFGVHYVHRTLVFPFRMVGSKPSSALTTLLALVFCAVNGTMQTRWILCGGAEDAVARVGPVVHAVGLLVFVLGMAANIHSDSILIGLRKPGESGYRIPRGGLFDYVSGANFFGEICEWVGFAIASGGAVVPVAFALFTMANIGPRAVSHHAWYLKEFGDAYPKDRKALIPFVL